MSSNGRVYIVDLKAYLDFIDGKVYPQYFAGRGVLLQHAASGVLLLPDKHGAVHVEDGEQYRLVELGASCDYVDGN